MFGDYFLQLSGELICFAVDATASTQVRFNRPTGTATLVYFDLPECV
jgi:hypothetical protein